MSRGNKIPRFIYLGLLADSLEKLEQRMELHRVSGESCLAYILSFTEVFSEEAGRTEMGPLACTNEPRGRF